MHLPHQGSVSTRSGDCSHMFDVSLLNSRGLEGGKKYSRDIKSMMPFF